MVLLRFGLAAALIATGCAGQHSTSRLAFEGGSIKAPGYRVEQERNQDTSASIGVLVNPRKNIQINYSIFSYESVFAEPWRLKATGYEIVWSRSDGIGMSKRITTLAEDTNGTRRLYISFPDGGPANFVADIETSTEIDEVENIVQTFEPQS